jgi:hypothetical protein
LLYFALANELRHLDWTFLARRQGSRLYVPLPSANEHTSWKRCLSLSAINLAAYIAEVDSCYEAIAPAKKPIRPIVSMTPIGGGSVTSNACKRWTGGHITNGIKTPFVDKYECVARIRSIRRVDIQLPVPGSSVQGYLLLRA